jgi:CBS domain containing-hemolysin-like protein
LENPDTFTYSRVPVYEGTIDKIIGILPTKRLYPFLLNPQKVDVRSLLITPLFVIHGQTISSILKLFKDTHQHIAIVIDEYGGTEGIITLEDILEEIVGEIWDENDEVTLKVIQPSSNVYIIDGSLQIEDFFSLVSWRGEVESDYSTLGGWCQEKLGRFGRQGDSFIFHHLKFIVLQADEFTIEKIRVEIENHSS